MRRVLAVVLALGVAAAVFFLRRTGVLHGVPAVVLAVLLVLIAPTSRLLSRRVVLGGALLLGWVPLLWWVRLPVPAVDRTGILLAPISGALVLWVLWGPAIRERARRLIPQVAVVDAMPVVAGGIAAWATWPFLTVPSAARLLQFFIDGRGHDQVVHLSQVLMIRAKGVIEPMMGVSPDGSAWQWTGWYPEHPHAAMTSLIELYCGPAVGNSATEVIRYGRGVAAMIILMLVLLIAGVAQLPSLRRHALIAWPVGAMVVAAFLFGLGSWSVIYGWWNFVSACATAGLAALVGAAMDDKLRPLQVFALGGLVVATVHGWPQLAPLAVVAAVVAFVPPRRDRWPTTRGGWAKMITAVVVTLAASLAVIPVLTAAGGIGALNVSTFGLFSGIASRLTPLLLAGGMALAVGLAGFVRKQSPESAWKGISLAAIPAVGFLLLGFVGVYQLVTAGGVYYYFDKVLAGVSLVSIPVLAAGVAVNLGPPSTIEGRARKSAAVAASVFAALAALQLFGLSAMHYRTIANQFFSAPAPAGENVLQAAEVSASRPFGETVYLAVMPGNNAASLHYQYQLALSLMWTNDTERLIVGTLDAADASDGTEFDGLDVRGAVEAARALLEADAQRSVVVAPGVVDSVRSLLPADLRSRVVTWGTLSSTGP